MSNAVYSPALIAVFVLLIATGCSDPAATVPRPEPCSTRWYELVESSWPTGDGMGHGPDIGSVECKSVVEFKLGIRDDPGVPERTSQAWCEFIDERL
jgi:hypothetical protein